MSNIKLMECKKHGITEFSLGNDGKYRCNKCSSDNVIKRRRNLKIQLIEYKGGKCEICGYNKCYRALEFHHIDPSQKEFKIASANRSLDTLKEEVDKCILVCANCHMEIHDKIEKEKQDEYNRIIKNNQEEYNKHHNAQKKCKRDGLDINNIMDDINNGLRQKEIAKKYNVSIPTIKRFISSNGINMKHPLKET